MPDKPPLLKRPRTWFIAVPVLVLLAVVVAPFVYIHFIEGDAPDALSIDDAVVSTTSTSVDDPSSDDDGSSSSTTAAGATDPASTDGIAGGWAVTSGSTAGYRAKEVLFGQDATAVGRTSDVTGTMTITGTTVTATDITVDMTTVSSDKSQRDGQFRGRIMQTDQFPTATFHLTSPIELGSLPAEGATKAYTATGDLTLHGVKRSVTLDLEAKRQSGAIVVQGSTSVDFDDFDIPDASGGPASVGRTGTLELLLVFARS